MMRALVTALFLCFASVCWAQQMTQEDAVRLLNEGNDLFREANEKSLSDVNAARKLYRKSAMRFESITRAGIRNGQLYYNIGNAYFRMGDLGRAILNYRRAELYIPNDHNLQQNLAFARSRQRDRVSGKQRGILQNVFLVWHYDLSAHSRTIIFCVFFILLWLFAVIRLFRKSAAPRILIGAFAALAIMFGASLAYDTIVTSRKQVGVVTAREVTARKGDGQTYQPSFKKPLHNGLEFTVVGKRGDWLHIQLDDDRACWIPSSASELVVH